VAVAGCAILFGEADPPRGTWPCCDTAGALELVYLGAGGWLIKYEGTRLLTAPFVTNPGLADVSLRPLHSDTAALRSLLPDLTDVQAILIGHSHYDHLLDIPFVATELAPNATLYGTPTTKNVLAAVPDLVPERVRALATEVASPARDGTWIQVAPRARILAMEADHAPHFMGVELYEGFVSEPQTQLPQRVQDWVGGATLTFLIELLDAEGAVAHRIYYQDAATDRQTTQLPPALAAAGTQVDVAILCAPSHAEVEDHPESVLLNMAPRHVLVGHWEDFFKPWGEAASERSVVGSNLGAFLGRLDRTLPDRATWTLPYPGDTVWVAAP